MITVEGVCKSFQEQKVLDDISFRMEEGKVYCLYGPSGSGKTTLMKIVGGLLLPDCGRVSGLEGKKLSFVFQEDRLLPWRNGKDNITLVTGEAPGAEKALALMELTGDKYPEEMSGGMRRRLAIARALAYGGDVYFFDEPFKGLDREMKLRIMNKVKAEIAGKTLLFISHDREEAEFFGCDQPILVGVEDQQIPD